MRRPAKRENTAQAFASAGGVHAGEPLRGPKAHTPKPRTRPARGIAWKLTAFILLLCALLFAVHILIIDYFAARVDGVRMSCIQFFVCGIISAVPMCASDIMQATSVSAWAQGLTTPQAWIAILYAGVLSCGAGYTLQIIGQQGVNPTAASLILSLESVFSVLAGWVILGEALQFREILGCVMIFGAVIFAQLPLDGRKTVS